MSCSCHVAGPKSTCQARLDAPGPGAGAGPVHNPTGSGVFAGAERQHPAGPASPDPEQPGQTARRSRCGQTPAWLMAAGQARDMHAPPGGVPSQDVATDSSLPSCPGQTSVGLPGLAPALRMAWAQVPCGRVQAGISLDLAALGLGERCLCIRTQGRQASFCLTGPCQCLRGGRCRDHGPRKSPHHQQGAAVAPNDQTFAAMEKSYCFQGPG